MWLLILLFISLSNSVGSNLFQSTIIITQDGDVINLIDDSDVANVRLFLAIFFFF
jgi:hypothetical protein